MKDDGYITEANEKKLDAQYPLAYALAMALGWYQLNIDGVHEGVAEMNVMFAHCSFDLKTGDVTIHCEDPSDAEDFAICYPRHEFKLSLTGGLENWTLMQFVEICDALVGKYILISEGGRQPDEIEAARAAATAYERDPDGTRDRKSDLMAVVQAGRSGGAA